MSNFSTSISRNPVLAPASRTRLLAIVMIAALGLAGNVAATTANQADTAATARHRAMDDDHLSKVIEFLEARIEQHQREQVDKLVHEADKDLKAFERKTENVRAPVAEILLADVVDRDALDRARVDELHIADERSRRVNQLLMDVAAVLTSQQRARLRIEMTK